MSAKLGHAADDGAFGFSDSDVLEFLARNPSFLADHPEILEVLTPPSLRTGRRVLDMQQFTIERLQTTLGKMRAHEGDLSLAVHDNRSSLSRVHAAILALCEPGALDDLVAVITDELPAILEADAVAICVEGDETQLGPLPAAPGVCLVATGTADAVMGKDEVRLVNDPTAANTAFGVIAASIQSSALLRLQLGRPRRSAFVALGSRDAARFEPGQGTELLAFLGEALSRRLREWLDRAP